MTDPSSPPLPLLITGVAGVAGFNAFRYFHGKYPGRVVGIRQTDNWRLRGDGIVACNAEDCQGLTNLFERHRFGGVLDCAGNCALKSCELDPRMAWRINVEGVNNVVALAVQFDARLVRLSVDLVFSGRGDGGLVESDATDPVTVYGATMVAAEQLIAATAPSACTLRISLPMGVSFNGHAGAIDWIQSRFKKRRPATLYFDEVRTPTYTDCLNRLCEAVLARAISGLFHAGGPRRLSLFEIAQIINRVGGYDPALLMGCQRIAAGPVPPRAGNVSLDSSRLSTALGYCPFDPWPLDDAFVPTDREWHRRRDAFVGSSALLAQVLYANPRYATQPV